MTQDPSAQDPTLHINKFDWLSPSIQESTLLVWNPLIKDSQIQQAITSCYIEMTSFSILISQHRTIQDKQQNALHLLQTIQYLYKDEKSSIPLRSKYFLGFLTWDAVKNDPEFAEICAIYDQMNEKEKKVLENETKVFMKLNSEAKLEKSGTLTESEKVEMLGFVTISRKSPTFKLFYYVDEEIKLNLSSVVIMSTLDIYFSTTKTSLLKVHSVKMVKKFRGCGAKIKSVWESFKKKVKRSCIKCLVSTKDCLDSVKE